MVGHGEAERHASVRDGVMGKIKLHIALLPVVADTVGYMHEDAVRLLRMSL